MTGTPDLWAAELPSLLDEIWRRLARATADRRAAMRFAVLATMGHDGGAEARTVVLRHADRALARLEIYTDYRTEKVRELKANPGASLVAWDPKARLQVRLRAHAEIATGPGVKDRWDALPRPARQDYAAVIAPGTPATLDQRAPDPDATYFAVISLIAKEIDAVHLGDDRHRRAVFKASDAWQGQWLQP